MSEQVRLKTPNPTPEQIAEARYGLHVLRVASAVAAFSALSFLVCSPVAFVDGEPALAAATALGAIILAAYSRGLFREHRLYAQALARCAS
jgi:hypothetical protein